VKPVTIIQILISINAICFVLSACLIDAHCHDVLMKLLTLLLMCLCLGCMNSGLKLQS